MSTGIETDRRTLLSVPLFAAAARWGAPPADEFAPLAFGAFAEAWVELARAAFPAAEERDAAYLGRLLALLARLPLEELPDFRKRNESEEFTAGPLWYEAGAAVIRFDMAPGAVLEAHDHPPQIVLTAGIAGTCTYRHFESVGPPPPHASREEFRVRETRSGILEAGRTTALTRGRDWIHSFEAGPGGASIADFTFTLSSSNEFSYVDVSPEPEDAAARVYRAVWKERDAR